MLLHGRGDFRIIRRLGLSRERAKENSVLPAEIIQPWIVLFPTLDERRPKIAISESMAQRVIDRCLRDPKQLFISRDQRAAQRSVDPVASLFPRPPGIGLLLAGPVSPGVRSCYLGQVQAQ